MITLVLALDEDKFAQQMGQIVAICLLLALIGWGIDRALRRGKKK